MGVLLNAMDKALYGFLGDMAPDERTKDWFLVDNVGLLIVVSTAYVLFIMLGPRVMQNLKPFDLKGIIMVYNVIMVIANAYIFQQAMSGGWMGHYKLFCQPLGTVDDPRSYQVARAQHYYFLTKYVELLDTIFFILRKKDRQVTFLHCYHHFAMLVSMWAATRYLPDGQASLGMTCNTFIHVAMYTYYLLSSMGPQVQKYLWWKRYLTRLQLIQFAVVLVNSLFVLHPSCGFPKTMMLGYGTHMVLFFILFFNFYMKNYTDSSGKPTPSEEFAKICIPNAQVATKQD